MSSLLWICDTGPKKLSAWKDKAQSNVVHSAYHLGGEICTLVLPMLGFPMPGFPMPSAMLSLLPVFIQYALVDRKCHLSANCTSLMNTWGLP